MQDLAERLEKYRGHFKDKRGLEKAKREDESDLKELQKRLTGDRNVLQQTKQMLESTKVARDEARQAGCNPNLTVNERMEKISEERVSTNPVSRRSI